MSVEAYLNPTIIYGQWEGWDGIPLDQPPLLYNGLTESAVNLLSSVSHEVVKIAKVIELKTGADMSRVRDFNLYEITHLLNVVLSFVIDVRGTNKHQRSKSSVWREGPEGKQCYSFLSKQLVQLNIW